jgi:ABC-type polysaccharide/polyol phosphate transport system, ATPase component
MAAEATGGSRNHDRLRLDEFWAVNGVSFKLRHGECLGLIGGNGAGKTTLLKMLNGLIKPDKGEIEMRGRVGALIALGAGFNPILTGRENIYVNGSVLGLTKREVDEKIEEIIDFAEIREFIDSPVQSYSSGMAVRLGFAVASSLNPDILLLDEVLAVGDMQFQAKCLNTLGKMRSKGSSFILVSHSMVNITRYCDHVLYLKKGQIAYSGRTEQGVEMLLKDMMIVQPTNEHDGKTHKMEEAGSFAVVIEEAYFATGKGERVNEIACGESVNLVLHYRCRKGPVVNPVLEVVLRDQTGDAWFHGSNKISGVDLAELRDTGRLTVAFPSLPANNQVLSAAIALWDSSMDELIYWCRGLKLRVVGHPSSTGRVRIECQWLKQPVQDTSRDICVPDNVC